MENFDQYSLIQTTISLIPVIISIMNFHRLDADRSILIRLPYGNIDGEARHSQEIPAVER